MFLGATVGGVGFELQREAFQSHGAPVGFDEEIEPAFGTPQAEEAVRGYWDGRVLVRERHLYCVEKFAAFAPEEEFDVGSHLTRKAKHGADVADEQGVANRKVVQVAVL